MVWFAAVAMYLSSSGSSTYRIYYESTSTSTSTATFRTPDQPLPPPPSCGDGNCLNPKTNNSYWLEDECLPEVFEVVNFLRIFFILGFWETFIVNALCCDKICACMMSTKSWLAYQPRACRNTQ